MLTITQAAERLGVRRERVWQLVKRGQLKAERFGSVWAVDEKSVQERLDNPPNPWRPTAKDGKKIF